MYLKRLEIRGFKSFADYTEISLNPGINIVIGPNGCGKSNIVDSIRWVLGEANIHNLRGQNFEDVIFNGSDSKKALGMASVHITIDNCDHTLPVAFEEVTVGRKVYRSGESEFYINKSRVRMKDINNLFIGTGLGKKGYSIISQGELEQVLNGQPFERRLILEEASGIIKYRQQRDEASRRITATEANLERVGDILAELKQRREELWLKAQKAEKYQALAGECTDLEKLVMATEINKTRQDVDHKTGKLAEQKAACDLTRKEWENGKNELADAEAMIDQQRRSFDDLKEKKYGADANLNNLKGKFKICEEKIKNCTERLDASSNDENKYLAMLEKISSNLETTTTDYQREQGNYLEKIKEVKALEAELNIMREHDLQARKDFAQFKKSAENQFDQQTLLEKNIARVEQGIKEIEERKERLHIHLEESSVQIKTLNGALAELAEKHSNACQETEAAENELKSIKVNKEQLENSKQELEHESQVINQEFMKCDNRLVQLNSQEKNYTVYPETIRYLMRAHQQGAQELAGIMGVVGDLLDVPDRMAIAIETAAGRGLSNVVVEKGEQAKRAIEYIKKHNLGRITFLPLDLLKVKAVPTDIIKKLNSMEGVEGIASDLVGFDARYSKAVNYLLGRVLIVSDLDNSLNIYKKLNYPLRIVTLEGDIINVAGAMSGGSNKNKGISPIQLKNEEKRLTSVLAQKRRQLDAVRSREADISNRLQEAERLYATGKNRLSGTQFQRELLQKEITQKNEELKKSLSSQEQYQVSISRLDQQLQQQAADLAHMQDRYQSCIQENDDYKEEMEKRQTGLETSHRDFEVKNERLHSYNDQVAMKKSELDNIRKNILQLEQVQSSYRESWQQAITLKKRLLAEKDAQIQQSAQLQQEITHLQEEFKVLNGQMEAARKEEQNRLAQITALKQQLVLPQGKIDELQASIRSLEIAIARAETELNGLLARWQNQFKNLSMDVENLADKEISARDIREYKRRITLLREQLDELGTVDLDAIKEYEEINQRCMFISSQYQDLEEAKNSLISLLKETEDLMIKEFEEFLLQANDSFNQTFKAIFDGGEARLKLDQGNPFEAGIEINVKVPGKRAQPLNLLSGGERALTCIAFIFSLLSLRPAPFCLLDEIDASLDEINLNRFCRFLKDMSRKIQFIVISHRQVTIQASENIFGVTMREKGISSVLSLSLADAESMVG